MAEQQIMANPFMASPYCMQVLASKLLVIDDPTGATETIGFRDWQERLEAWLAPTARIPDRRPLTFERVRKVPDPTIYQVQNKLVAHPVIIRQLQQAVKALYEHLPWSLPQL